MLELSCFIEKELVWHLTLKNWEKPLMSNGKLFGPVSPAPQGPGKEHFDPLSLIGLRTVILEKFGQWKDRAGYVDGPGRTFWELVQETGRDPSPIK